MWVWEWKSVLGYGWRAAVPLLRYYWGHLRGKAKVGLGAGLGRAWLERM